MDDLLKDIWKSLLSYWHKPWAFVGLIFIFTFFLIKLFSSFEFETITNFEWGIILALVLIISSIWFFTTRLPKAKKNWQPVYTSHKRCAKMGMFFGGTWYPFAEAPEDLI